MSCRVWIGNQRRHHFVSARAHLLSSAYMRHQFDYLVLGSGIAGLSFALQAARHGSVAPLGEQGDGPMPGRLVGEGKASDSGPEHEVVKLVPNVGRDSRCAYPFKDLPRELLRGYRHTGYGAPPP